MAKANRGTFVSALIANPNQSHKSPTYAGPSPPDHRPNALLPDQMAGPSALRAYKADIDKSGNPAAKEHGGSMCQGAADGHFL